MPNFTSPISLQNGQLSTGTRRFKEGTLTIPNVGTYVGTFCKGKYHGQGTFTYANGNMFTGQFSQGKVNEMGSLRLIPNMRNNV